MLREFVQKPSGYLLFRASLSDDVTGLQIARWLKTAPPRNVTAVSIEAVVSRARHMQGSLRDGAFPTGSVFEKLSKAARDEIVKGIRGLNTVMAATAEYATDDAITGEAEYIEKSLVEIQDRVSTLSTAIETPLLLDITSGRSPTLVQEVSFNGLMAAADVDAALLLREAILQEDPSSYSREISRDKILGLHKSDGSVDKSSQRFKLRTMDGQPVIMETYKYKELPDSKGEPQPQTLRQVRKITGLLCHPKRKEFHILPCAGFFRDRLRKEMGMVFRAPSMFEENKGVVTLLQLYKLHQIVPLGQRIHLAWTLTTAVENFHRVGWVHKSIRSDNIAFAAVSPNPDSDLDDSSPASPFVDRFNLSKPLLFGFEYSRASDEATYLEEDYSETRNLYRHPNRWDCPTARFKKSHDVYSLGVVLLEIARWEEAELILGRNSPTASEASRILIKRCSRSLAHKVGQVFVQCIVTCLEFGLRTKDMSEYDAQRYFQRNVTEPMGKAVLRV